MDDQDHDNVLHRLLCAAWDGKVAVAGDMNSPDHITVEIGSRDSVPMRLGLTPLGALSSWATVLQAYEQWILADDNPSRRGLASRLMSTVPSDADRSPRQPAAAFAAIVDLASPELLKIKQAEQSKVLARDPQLAVLRDFWGRALPAALHRQISGTSKNLLELREQVDVAHELGG
ncbi:hypothetical protein [Actinophytocola sp.]|uniref:hypothetical protein n=1 Tax=Actinophytocola sp. TaxID=1872138 RepID=UPI002ED03331